MEPRELREQLIAWANINSGSTNLPGLERMRGALLAAFSRFRGIIIEEVNLPGTPARALSVRQRPEAPLHVLLSGHYDTVYDAEHPFQSCEIAGEEILRGPGVADMKGGIVVLLAALHEFERTAVAPCLGWEVLLTPDEETGSKASRTLLTEAAGRHQCGLVFEPAREDGSLVRSRKGVGVFTVSCHGRAAHAGNAPLAGRNAIVLLGELIGILSGIPTEIPGVLLNVGRIEGGGPVNIVPDFARAEIDVRATTRAGMEDVTRRIQEWVGIFGAREGFRVELAGGFERPPWEVSAASERLFCDWQAAATACGAGTFGWLDVGGGSDANLLNAAGLPCLDGLGPVGGKLHSSAEYVHLRSLRERAQITAGLLTRLAERGTI